MDTFRIAESVQNEVDECGCLHCDIFECTVHLRVSNFIIEQSALLFCRDQSKYYRKKLIS